MIAYKDCNGVSLNIEEEPVVISSISGDELNEMLSSTRFLSLDYLDKASREKVFDDFPGVIGVDTEQRRVVCMPQDLSL